MSDKEIDLIYEKSKNQKLQRSELDSNRVCTEVSYQTATYKVGVKRTIYSLELENTMLL